MHTWREALYTCDSSRSGLTLVFRAGSAAGTAVPMGGA